MGKNIKKKKRKENKEIIEKKDIEKKENKKRKKNLQGISTQKNISMGITCKMNGGKIERGFTHKKYFLWELLVN